MPAKTKPHVALPSKPSVAHLKTTLTPLVLVGKGALGKLAPDALERLGELVAENKLRELALTVEGKRLVALTARPDVTTMKGATHVKALGLKRLYLQYGKGLVKSFEDGFFDDLEEVEMQAGVVNHLPPGLWSQRRLRSLEIHNTPMKLPEKVAWPKLETLRLASTGPTLPEGLLLPTLRSLAISAWKSKLKTIPESIGTLTKLWQLDLSDNQLTALPAGMATLRGLRHLQLKGNKLKVLPDWLATLKLETLAVDNPLPPSLQRFAR